MKIVPKALLLIALATAIYYLFFLPYEFRVTFSAKTHPGDIVQTIRIWNRSLKEAEITQVDSFKSVSQRIVLGGRKYLCNWKFQYSDSSTLVDVEISEPAHRIANKLSVLFGEPTIEKDGTELAKQFYDVLKYHLKLTSVKITGEEQHDPEFCICHSIDKPQIDKGYGMMQNYLFISTYIESNGLKLAGIPSVRLKKWSHNQGKIEYDFCFPIVQEDLLPNVEGLFYKHFNGFKGIKAQYKGNYLTSDRSWYELYDYASKAGYEIQGLPVEYFLDNPNFGTKDTEWRAEIFLPVARKEP